MGKFFHFSQNNSGGTFDFDVERGITHHVIIEAPSAAAANRRAEAIGLYFGGVYRGDDCPCCGDRWSDMWRDAAGDPAPMVYGQPVAGVVSMWMDDGREAVVHYADGRREWHGIPRGTK